LNSRIIKIDIFSFTQQAKHNKLKSENSEIHKVYTESYKTSKATAPCQTAPFTVNQSINHSINSFMLHAIAQWSISETKNIYVTVFTRLHC